MFAVVRRLVPALLLAFAVAAPVRALPAYAPGVVITQHPGAVGRNKTATLAARSTPGNQSCSITVQYKSGPGKAAGLVPKKSDAAGKVSWVWKVGGNTTKGTWPIIVKCGQYGVTSKLIVP